MSTTVMVVEDEIDLVENLEYNLVEEGYEVVTAMEGAVALEHIDGGGEVDLVVLDLMLPDMTGYEVCEAIRERSQTVPILMLTARGEEMDRIRGFEVGADDYVVKPFSVRELKLRIRAILKRVDPYGGDEELKVGSLVLDGEAHRVWVEEESVELTPLEYKLMEVLMSRRGKTQSRNVLLRDVWAIEADINTRTVDTHVQRLRAKLGEAGEVIETVRGVGYRCSTKEEL